TQDAFASAAWTRSSGACWSPVRAWATLSRACVRCTTKSTNSRSTSASTRHLHPTDAGGGPHLSIAVVPRAQTGRVSWVGVESPIGPLGVAVDAAAVYGISFGGAPREASIGPPSGAELESSAVRQLAEYFAGERTEFGVPHVFVTGTKFERAVWRVIATIPY